MANAILSHDVGVLKYWTGLGTPFWNSALGGKVQNLEQRPWLFNNGKESSLFVLICHIQHYLCGITDAQEGSKKKNDLQYNTSLCSWTRIETLTTHILYNLRIYFTCIMATVYFIPGQNKVEKPYNQEFRPVTNGLIPNQVIKNTTSSVSQCKRICATLSFYQVPI